MSDITSQLEMEKRKRIAALLSTFVKIGHAELVDDYKAIVTLEDTIALFTKPTSRTRSTKAIKAYDVGNDEPAPAGFVLSDEVRRAILKIKSERFRMNSVYEILREKWSAYITPDKKPRIAATLSNLAAANELSIDKDGQRKTWYSVKKLREVAMHDDEFYEELFAELN